MHHAVAGSVERRDILDFLALYYKAWKAMLGESSD
jgi:hypothetical protein